jgi:2-keto-4-pentenoate hydratase/2-oxohepta-3-ene-1,7-dioic acid hydratase in catechol pathway
LRIATYQRLATNAQMELGLVSDDGASIRPLAFANSGKRGALGLIEEAAASGVMPSRTIDEQLALASVRLHSPLPLPRRNLFCVGRNYHAHARELSASVFKGNAPDPESWPIVFTKVPECVIGPHDDVQLPGHASTQIDYEAELAVVIGLGGRNIARSDAMRHVFGYTIVNDVTARDVQMRHQQWDLGKSFDTFCPMGPWIATADSFDGERTRVRCWVNEELRQDAQTTDLIFDIPTLIETCSRGITLYPGDVIATGTPAGVGMGMKPPTFLKSGDVVRIEIQGLGEIQNRFV